jgi:hypothetical protein
MKSLKKKIKAIEKEICKRFPNENFRIITHYIRTERGSQISFHVRAK